MGALCAPFLLRFFIKYQMGKAFLGAFWTPYQKKISENIEICVTIFLEINEFHNIESLRPSVFGGS
jgi:hypothetical protein